jgi:hypothetical protein
MYHFQVFFNQLRLALWPLLVYPPTAQIDAGEEEEGRQRAREEAKAR